MRQAASDRTVWGCKTVPEDLKKCSSVPRRSLWDIAERSTCYKTQDGMADAFTGLYWGYIGIMEKKMETTRVIMENQMEKKMENEMETGII